MGFGKLNKKALQYVRLAVQIVFLALTLFGLSFGSMLYKRLAMFGMFLLIGTYFCGWLCPFGTIQDLLWRFNRRFIKREITIPWKIDRWLSWLRYVTLLTMFFAVIGTISEILDARRALLMLVNGRTLTIISLVCLGVVLLLSLFMRRPFCRYICPEGARYGTIGMSRLFTVTRNNEVCVHCGACDRACPMAIPVSKIAERESNLASLNTPQCISCASCLSVCPKKGALTLKLRRYLNPVTLICFLIGMYFLVSSVKFTVNRFGGFGASETQSQEQRLHGGQRMPGLGMGQGRGVGQGAGKGD